MLTKYINVLLAYICKYACMYSSLRTLVIRKGAAFDVSLIAFGKVGRVKLSENCERTRKTISGSPVSTHLYHLVF